MNPWNAIVLAPRPPFMFTTESKGKKHIRPKRNKRVARQAEEENSETENDDCNDENNDNESSTDETGHLTSLAVSFSNVEC